MDNQDGIEDDDALSNISFDARLAFTVRYGDYGEEV